MLRNPLAKELTERFQLEKELIRRLANRGLPAYRAARLLQFARIIGYPARVARIAILLRRAALGTDPFDEAVGEEHPVMFAVELFHRHLPDGACFLHRGKDGFGEFLVFRGICRIVVVEGNLEVGEVGGMLGVAAGDELLRGDSFFSGAHHNGRAVGVVCADIDAFVTAHFLESHPEVGLEVFYEVPDMDGSVGVGQG